MSINFDSLFSHPLDLSWVITAVIAIAAFLSPVAVALINNHHAYKMKKLEFCHEENMKKLSLSHEAAQKQFEIYYTDKKLLLVRYFAPLVTLPLRSNLLNAIKMSTPLSIQLFCSVIPKTKKHLFRSWIKSTTKSLVADPQEKNEQCILPLSHL